MQKQLFILALGFLLTGCGPPPDYNAGITMGPLPRDYFKEAMQACPLKLPPLDVIAEKTIGCANEGVSTDDNVANTKCVAAKLRKTQPQIFAKYPALAKIEKIALSAPKQVSGTEVTYIKSNEHIQALTAEFVKKIVDANPHAITKCYNQALLDYVAPKSASPASYLEYTAQTEDVSLMQQSGKLSADEAEVQRNKALAVLKYKLEQAVNQRQQASLMQAQVDAANAQAAAANSQAAAARSLAIQNAFRSFQPAPAVIQPAYISPMRQTNCHAFGNNLNCTTY